MDNQDNPLKFGVITEEQRQEKIFKSLIPDNYEIVYKDFSVMMFKEDVLIKLRFTNKYNEVINVEGEMDIYRFKEIKYSLKRPEYLFDYFAETLCAYIRNNKNDFRL